MTKFNKSTNLLYSFLDYPDQCFYDGKAYSIGTHRPEGECYEIKCSEKFEIQKNM